MTQLTKEYFDEHLRRLATKHDLERLVTKDHLDEALAELEERLNTKLDALHQMLDVRHRIEKLERVVDELRLQRRQ